MVQACPMCDQLLLVTVGRPSRLDAKLRHACLSCHARLEPNRNRAVYAFWFAFAAGVLLGGTWAAFYVVPVGGWVFLLLADLLLFIPQAHTVFIAPRIIDFVWRENTNTCLTFVRFRYRESSCRVYTADLCTGLNTLVAGVLASARSTLGHGSTAYRVEVVVSLYPGCKEVHFRKTKGAHTHEIDQLDTAIKQLPTPPIPGGVAYFEFEFLIGDPSTALLS